MMHITGGEGRGRGGSERGGGLHIISSHNRIVSVSDVMIDWIGRGGAPGGVRIFHYSLIISLIDDEWDVPPWYRCNRVEEDQAENEVVEEHEEEEEIEDEEDNEVSHQHIIPILLFNSLIMNPSMIG